MKLRVFLTLLLSTVNVLAYGSYPAHADPYNNSIKKQSDSTFKNTDTSNKVVAYQPNYSYYQTYYHPGFYPHYYHGNQTTTNLKPKTDKQSKSSESNELTQEVQKEINTDLLDKKSELAMRQNDRQHQLQAIEQDLNEDDLKQNFKVMDLSNLTANRLISSARKKQFLNKILPIILNNHRLFYQDRVRLEKLASAFEKERKLSAEDEAWLYKIIKEYKLPITIYDDKANNSHSILKP